MVDILHKVGVRSPVERVFTALTTIDGLSGWWTSTTSGDAAVGGTIVFRFGPHHFDIKVLEQRPGARVVWQVTDGPAEWIGTRIRFDLRQEGAFAIVLFKHEGWAEPVEFMHHCSTKWGVFMMSLKALIETGQGTPHPHDPKIDDWN